MVLHRNQSRDSGTEGFSVTRAAADATDSVGFISNRCHLKKASVKPKADFLKNYFLLLWLIMLSCSPDHDNKNLNEPLFYQVQGTGKPSIIFLHGILGSHRYWDGVVPRLRQHHELILIDLLGFGKSAKPQLEYSVQQHITKIADVVNRTQPKDDRSVIVGHSMGSYLALNYAIAYPDRVKKLILINAPMNSDEASLKKAIAESSSQLMVTMTFSKTWGKLVCKIHELIPLISYPLIRIFEPELPPAVAEAAGQHVYASYSGSFENILLKQNFYELLEKIPNVPVLIISGSTDEYTKNQPLQQLPTRLTVKFVKIDGDHNVLLKKPQRISEEILKFIE